MTRGDSVAVYGSTGYTGRRVAAALVAHGARVCLSGRDVTKLRALAATLGRRAYVVPATLDDPEALAALASGVGAIVNCAGPFSESSRALAAAAIAGGAHYLDVSAEQGSAKSLCEQLDERAREAGVAVLPAYAFYTAVSDALATVLSERLGPVEDLAIAYRIADWRPPSASFRSRIDGLAREWFVYDDGLQTMHAWPRTSLFDFGGDVGVRRMTAYPTADVVILPRHLPARRVDARLTAETLAPRVLGRLLPAIANLARNASRTRLRSIVERLLAALWSTTTQGGAEKDPTTFDVIVCARSNGTEQRARASGAGIHDVSAHLVASAAWRLCLERPRRCGVLSPAEAFGAPFVLGTLAQCGTTLALDVVREPSPVLSPEPRLLPTTFAFDLECSP